MLFVSLHCYHEASETTWNLHIVTPQFICLHVFLTCTYYIVTIYAIQMIGYDNLLNVIVWVQINALAKITKYLAYHDQSPKIG